MKLPPPEPTVKVRIRRGFATQLFGKTYVYPNEIDVPVSKYKAEEIKFELVGNLTEPADEEKKQAGDTEEKEVKNTYDKQLKTAKTESKSR